MDFSLEQLAQFGVPFLAFVVVMTVGAHVLRAYRHRVPVRQIRRVRSRPLIASQAASPAAPAPAWADAPAAGTATPLRSWLDRINNQPDKTPHLAVTGPSGSGKTTFVLAALSERPGRLVVCTPKNETTDPWGGFPAIRLRRSDMSYAPISTAIQAVYAEMKRRNAHNVATDDDWLTLVVDDYSTVVGEQPELKPFVLRLLTLGRSVRIRLVIIDTETNVKAWGIEGRGEARHNLIYVECEEDTHAVRMYRWKERESPQAIDTTHVYALATRARLGARAWEPVSSVSDGLAPFERALAGVGEESGRTSTSGTGGAYLGAVGGTPNQYEIGTADTDAADGGTEDMVIAFLVRQGKSANFIFDAVGGTRSIVLEKVRKAKETLDTP